MEWLKAFYTFIRSNRVLLLMDNFSAHIAAIKLSPPPANIRIQWLPANSTSITQPLNQGIINSFKAHYKRRWLRYMIDAFKQNLNPFYLMNLYHALRWVGQAWPDISDTTIYRCFRKAKVLDQDLIQLPAEPQVEIEALFRQVQISGKIQEIMSIQNFLNPANEDILLLELADPGVIEIKDIIAKYINMTEEAIENNKDNKDKVIKTPILSDSKALQALRILKRYQEY